MHSTTYRPESEEREDGVPERREHRSGHKGSRTDWLNEPTDLYALTPYGHHSCHFDVGGPDVPASAKLLGSDHHDRHHAVGARYDARQFLATFFGTAIGATVGAVVATYSPLVGTVVFGISVFLLGLCCAAVHADRAAYRFAGVTLGIVLLVPGTERPSLLAFHRFAEVSVGIAVALIMTVVWPDRGPAKPR